jgi:GPI mannosyltransferase 1 subunit M
MRDTYRYTPLLALLMTPNIFLHPSFGKLLFSLCDLLVGAMLYDIICSFPPGQSIKASETKRKATLWVSALWLLNPFVFSISTRGSAESVLGLLVVGTLYLVLKGHRQLAALLFGLSVHWKIYPLIYGTSILAFYGAQSRDAKARSTNWIVQMATRRGIAFGMLSATAFTGVTGVLYLV